MRKVRTTPGPRERLKALGIDALSDEELIALLLGTGSKGKDVHTLAREVLRETHGLAGLLQIGHGALMGVAGMGMAKAARLVAAMEMGRRMATQPCQRTERIDSSRDVDQRLRGKLAHQTKEKFMALILDAKRRIVAEVHIAEGGLVACSVTPADVFRALLRHAPSGVVFAHNHPSGLPKPSAEDVELTHQLCMAGKLLGVEVLDHVILGAEGYFSFRDSGLLRD